MQMIDNDPEYQTPAEERLQIVKDEVQDRDERIGALESTLSEIYDLFEDEMDVEAFSDGVTIPNQAMRICTMIEEVLGKGALK